jgi:3,4-dihydroxy 2-butanone 4-phosphate synthase/GTP cyclohydrolase II
LDLKQEYERAFDTIEAAIDAIRQGEMILVVDDDHRENEGDLVMAAKYATTESINFMARNARGLICAPIAAEIADRLGLEPMTRGGGDRHGTAFLVSVDAKEGTTTGISAEERAVTLRKLADPKSQGSDFLRPGHMFPLRSKVGGVLKRAGHTEAAVDLARLAGLDPAGVCCEIMNDQGKMSRLPELREFAREHGLKLISVEDLIAWRSCREKFIERLICVTLPTLWGEFTASAYKNVLEDDECHIHIALTKGDISNLDSVLVRVHSECLTGDVFGSMKCDCGAQLHYAMQMIEREGAGVVLYMRQEGRGIGIVEKLKAYRLQEQGLDTVEANLALGWASDLRDYGVGAQILVDLGLRKIRLITNNPQKIVGLQGHGIEVMERIPIEIEPNEYNRYYLNTKATKMGHLLAPREH